MLLKNFQSIRPPYETNQEDSLNWCVEAHAQAESHTSQSDASFRQTFKEKLWHVGCKPDRIAKRGHVLGDFFHYNWKEMEIYRLHETATGKNLSDRIKIYNFEVEKIFDLYYPEKASAPDDLIHVSCTGYVSPSGAQKIVSKRNWGHSTTVTHAYHMGCYASIPAIRMGVGFLNSAPSKKSVDLVHTEICCLHMNPSQHELDQLVSQSLFADGFIKYSIVKKTEEPHIKVLHLHEEIIPLSLKAMTWSVADWGFQMTLAKEIPIHIARHLPFYLERLSPHVDLKKALFAIHPGGPKILTHIQELLGLSDEQMRFSFQVLKEYGNMSSATLPHIWQKILGDPTVASQQVIISLAFGPGLTIAGAVLEKS